MKKTLRERFESKILQTDSCWIWTGAIDRAGYGRIAVDGRNEMASRVAWTLENGPIPDGFDVCHRCDNPPCVRVSHLFVGTRRDNMADMIAKGRAKHPAGDDHPFGLFTDAQAEEIRLKYRALVAIRKHGALTTLAREYGVTKHNIFDVLNRRKC